VSKARLTSSAAGSTRTARDVPSTPIPERHLTTAKGDTALVLLVPEADALVERWQDPMVRAGMPAHVTAIYPFLPEAEIDAETHGRLRMACASQPPLNPTFRRVGRFPNVLWLDPELSELLSDRRTRKGPGVCAPRSAGAGFHSSPDDLDGRRRRSDGWCRTRSREPTPPGGNCGDANPRRV
jgi:2'-5' RNA ligase superfamily